MNTKTKKIVISAMLAAVVCVATMIIKIPSPLKGYINLGDCFVLIAGWVLSPLYGFLAAGIGSALADFLSGYGVYIPATFVIKGLMAYVAYLVFKGLDGKINTDLSRILSAVVAEIVMIAGYLAFESALYGFAPSVVNVPFNAVQGAVGLILAFVLIKVLSKRNVI